MLKDELRRLRKGLRLSQNDLADALNVAQATIASWESGTRKPDFDTLQDIARFFNVSLDELCGYSPVEQNGDRELWEAREAARRDPERRILFSLAKNGTTAQVRQTVAIIDALKATNPAFYDGDEPS